MYLDRSLYQYRFDAPETRLVYIRYLHEDQVDAYQLGAYI